MDVVSVLNSLLQWEPENIMVASSSRLVGLTDIVELVNNNNTAGSFPIMKKSDLPLY